MNLDRLRTFYKVLGRAKAAEINFDISLWVSSNRCEDENDLIKYSHECETTCCAGGFLSLSKEWRKDGGKISPNGEPSYHDMLGIMAIERWLNTSDEKNYLWLSSLLGLSSETHTKTFYSVRDAKNITLDHVMRKMKDKIDELEGEQK